MFVHREAETALIYVVGVGRGGEGNFEVMLAVAFYSPRKTKEGPLSKFVNLAPYQVPSPSEILQVKSYSFLKSQNRRIPKP